MESEETKTCLESDLKLYINKERERETETDRQTERQTDRERERVRQRKRSIERKWREDKDIF